MINNLFHNFSDFDSADSTKLARIGSDSGNGFVVKIPFKQNGYTAYAALKSTSDNITDNLVYEYLVGTKFINQQNIRFPCFLETYSLTRYVHLGYHWAMSTLARVSESSSRPLFAINLKDMIYPVPTPDWKKVCSESIFFSILIQYFDNIETFREITRIPDKTELIPVLYQIYYVLDTLKNVYTHFDLNSSNVLVYKPFTGNVYMKMHYHQPDGTVVTLHCDRIAKLIDYGRNFVKTDTLSSNTIRATVEKIRECVSRLNEYDGNMNSVLNSPHIPNGTVDLYLVQPILEWLKTQGIHINPLVFDDDMPWDIPSNPRSNMVNNVTDMRRILENKWDVRHHLQHLKYHNWTCGGDMHIYPDGRPYTIQLHTIPDTLRPRPNENIGSPIHIVTLDPDVIRQKCNANHIHPMSLANILVWISNIMNTPASDPKEPYRILLLHYYILYVFQEVSQWFDDNYLRIYSAYCYLYFAQCKTNISAKINWNEKCRIPPSRLFAIYEDAKKLKTSELDAIYADVRRILTPNIQFQPIPEHEPLLKQNIPLPKATQPQFTKRVLAFLFSPDELQ